MLNTYRELVGSLKGFDMLAHTSLGDGSTTKDLNGVVAHVMQHSSAL